MHTTVKMVLDQKGRHVISLSGQENLLEAAGILTKHKVGAALILGPGNELRGIFSERDILHLLSKHQEAALTMTVSSAMTTEVTTCRESDSMASLIKRMTEGRFRHVPVVDAEHKVVGMISIGDVVKSRMRDIELEVNAMREYIQQ